MRLHVAIPQVSIASLGKIVSSKANTGLTTTSRTADMSLVVRRWRSYFGRSYVLEYLIVSIPLFLNKTSFDSSKFCLKMGNMGLLE